VSVFPASQLDTTTIVTPMGAYDVTTLLSQGADRLHTFDLEVCYAPDDMTTLTMQVHTISSALANPGQQVTEGRAIATFALAADTVIRDLPMGAGRAILRLPAHSVMEFVRSVQEEVAVRWRTSLEADMATERAVAALANEGFDALASWLATQPD